MIVREVYEKFKFRVQPNTIHKPYLFIALQYHVRFQPQIDSETEDYTLIFLTNCSVELPLQMMTNINSMSHSH
jgi:hypothetical protein